MADETSNSMSGENNGASFMAGEVHGNVTFHSPRKRSVMAFGAVALGAALLAVVFVAGSRFGDRPAPEAATTSTTPPPPSSAPPATTTTTAVQATKPPSPVPQPPAPAPKPADDGPGYLLTAGNTGEVVDTLGFTSEALLVARKAEGTYDMEVQRSWVREFSSATPDLFRFRNADKCLETGTGAAVRGEPVRLADCSWERAHQLWRAKNPGQAASAVSGECLGPGNASPPFGTSVVVTACQDGPAQRWQISR